MRCTCMRGGPVGRASHLVIHAGLNRLQQGGLAIEAASNCSSIYICLHAAWAWKTYFFATTSKSSSDAGM